MALKIEKKIPSKPVYISNPVDLNKYKGFAIIDFETVGQTVDVCQIGLKVFDVNNNEIFEFSKLVKPFDHFDGNEFSATYIHHITWNDVKNEDKFDVVWKQIEQHFNGDYLILAHNSGFDITRCLKYEFAKNKISYDNFDYGCTMNSFKKIWPNLESHKLDFLADMYNIKFKHHDALNDVIATKKIFDIGFKSFKDYLQKNNQLNFKIQYFK